MGLYSSSDMVKQINGQKIKFKNIIYGQNILIVGGSSGLGFELVKRNIKEQNNIYVLTKDIKRFKKNLYLKNIKNINFSKIDLQKINKIEPLIKKILKNFKNKIDLVIHVAGGCLGVYYIKTKHSDLITVLNLNILSLIVINNFLIPSMIKNKNGNIIHLSSIAAYEL